MANLFASKAQLVIAGANLQPTFNVGEGNLLSIKLRDDVVNTPVRALNYTPHAIGLLTQTTDVSIVFIYSYTDKSSLFDFSSLPYKFTNIQLQLLSITGKPLALVGGLYYKTSEIGYNAPGEAVTRAIVLGAFSINYFP